MKGDFLKHFAFLSLKQSESKRRSRSATISCTRDAILEGTSLSVHHGRRVLNDVDTRIDKEAHFSNHTIPKRRKQQAVKRERSQSVSGAVGQGRHVGILTTTRNFLTGSKKTKTITVDIGNFVVVEDFEMADIREVWRSFKDRGMFSETSLQNGFLTTTLCSTEL